MMIYLSRFDKYHGFKTLLCNVNFVHIFEYLLCVLMCMLHDNYFGVPIKLKISDEWNVGY
jgi:hypothetical protein